jgi:hypothetical protein
VKGETLSCAFMQTWPYRSKAEAYSWERFGSGGELLPLAAESGGVDGGGVDGDDEEEEGKMEETAEVADENREAGELDGEAGGVRGGVGEVRRESY